MNKVKETLLSTYRAKKKTFNNLTNKILINSPYCLFGEEVNEKMTSQSDDVTADSDDESTDRHHPSYFMPSDVTGEYLIQHLLALDTHKAAGSVGDEM